MCSARRETIILARPRDKIVHEIEIRLQKIAVAVSPAAAANTVAQSHSTNSHVQRITER